MKSILITLAFLATIVAVLVGIVAVNYYQAYEYGNRTEKAIQAQYSDNQNIYSNYGLKVKETLGISDKYAKDLTLLMEAALDARYGEDGSKAMFQWITENYPGQLDPSLYAKVQQIVEAGRTEFTVAQRSLLDKKRSYQTSIDSLWTGFWLRLAGYPKIDLKEIDIIVSDNAQKAFETKTDGSVLE